jgi:replication factor C small subunit
MIVGSPESYLWVEKYRPKRIEDCILTDKVHKQLQPMVKAGELQNLMLIGGPGIGKCLGYDTEINILVSDELYELIEQNK